MVNSVVFIIQSPTDSATFIGFTKREISLALEHSVSSASPSPDARGNAGSAGESATKNAAIKVVDAAETIEQEEVPPGAVFTVRAPQLGGMQR